MTRRAVRALRPVPRPLAYDSRLGEWVMDSLEKLEEQERVAARFSLAA
jgi:hypothetical protein